MTPPFLHKARGVVIGAAIAVLVLVYVITAAKRLLAPPLPVPKASEPNLPGLHPMPIENTRAPGGPIEGGESRAASGPVQYTNESLHALQEREKKKMGIDRITEPGGAEEEPKTLGSKAEIKRKIRATKEWMRRVSEQIERELEARTPPPVEVGGSTPALLDKSSDKQSAPGGPVDSPQAGRERAVPPTP